MKYATLFLLLLGVLGCKSNQKTETDTQMSDNQPLIDLETTPCRGYCPVYKLAVKNNGKVQYEGLRFVKTLGAASFALTPDELKSLKKRLSDTNLWQYPESFPVTIVDGPGATITVYKGTEEKTIRGSVERPKPIREIQEYLQSLAVAHGFSLESVNPNDIPPTASTGEMIVKLKPNVNAGNWLRDLNQTSNANLKLIRRMNAENIWVMAYDASKFTADDLLALLKSNADVEDAQLNRKVEERKE